MVDWIAVYDATTATCYYVDSGELGTGRARLHLRLVPALNNQHSRIRFAEDYSAFPVERFEELEK